MAGTRAFFASVGASVALVSAAALSLLTVSAVFAFGGWSAPASPFAGQPPLVLAADQAGGAPRPAAIVAPAPARGAARRSGRRAPAAVSTVSRTPRPAPAISAGGSRGAVGPVAQLDPPPTTTSAAPAPRKPGDQVRKVGDTLSSTLKGTGAALADATQPLAPPVSVAIQQVLNLLAEVVRNASNGLGTTVDRLAP